ncbi:MAG: hypothetical protein AAB449_00100 [Patescibacteria group bacterium]
MTAFYYMTALMNGARIVSCNDTADGWRVGENMTLDSFLDSSEAVRALKFAAEQKYQDIKVHEVCLTTALDKGQIQAIRQQALVKLLDLSPEDLELLRWQSG